MADRIEPFVVTIPAGTSIAGAQTFPMLFPDGIVTHITITVPPGPSGFVGFQLRHKGGPVIPYVGNTFIIADDRVIEWPVSNMPTATGWELFGYNTDVYDHTLYLEFQVDEIPVSTTKPVQFLDI